MRPDLKKQKDKSILAYVRELDKLNKVSRDAPCIPLAKPYQNGWTKYLVLRDDYTRRDDAHIFREILAEIGGEVFCRKMDFIDRQGNEYGPTLRTIGKSEWEKLGWTAQHRKHFQFGRFRTDGYFGMGWSNVIEGYRMVKPYFLVEKIKPHFITHTRILYPDVESRKTEIRNLFERRLYWERYSKLKGHRWNHYDDRCSAKENFVRALGTKEIEEYDKS